MNHDTDNLPGYPFVWRRAGDNPAPLNAGIRKTASKNTGGTPRQATAFGTAGGTMYGLSNKAQKITAFKPFNATVASFGGAYSKAVPQ